MYALRLAPSTGDKDERHFELLKRSISTRTAPSAAIVIWSSPIPTFSTLSVTDGGTRGEGWGGSIPETPEQFPVNSCSSSPSSPPSPSEALLGSGNLQQAEHCWKPNSVRECWSTFPPLLWAVGEGINLGLVNSCRSCRRRCSRIIRASLCLPWTSLKHRSLVWIALGLRLVLGESSDSSWGEHMWSGGRACWKRWLDDSSYSAPAFTQPSVNTMLAGLLLHWHALSCAVASVSNHDIWTLSRNVQMLRCRSLQESQSTVCVLFPLLCCLFPWIWDYYP